MDRKEAGAADERTSSRRRGGGSRGTAGGAKEKWCDVTVQVADCFGGRAGVGKRQGAKAVAANERASAAPGELPPARADFGRGGGNARVRGRTFETGLGFSLKPYKRTKWKGFQRINTNTQGARCRRHAPGAVLVTGV